MRRWKYLAAAAAAILLMGWGLYRTGWFYGSREKLLPLPASQVQNIDPMDSPSGWRYRQNQPQHWRYIMLQK
ncbi:MAG: hypothetical protein ACYC3I_20065 [Gemmataceae bacterium]